MCKVVSATFNQPNAIVDYMDGKRNRKIVVIGGGVVSRKNNKYYARSQLVEYLQDFLRFYSNVTWYVVLSTKNDYKNSLDIQGLNLCVLNPNYERLISLKGLVLLLRNWVTFWKQLDNKTHVIVSKYSLFSIPFLLIGRLKAKRVAYYLGSDPLLLISLRNKTLYDKVMSRTNYLLSPISLVLADIVFVRGKTVLKQVSKWNKNVIMSQPLISYKRLTKSLKGVKDRPLSKKTLNILFVGKLEENKGVHILLKAVAKVLQESGIDISVKIVGSGPLAVNLQKLSVNLGIDDKVVFHGFVDDGDKLVRLFKESDVFVVPTIFHEGFPRVIDEAMACGLPVICSRLGGMKDTLSDKDVLFVEPGNIDDLARAITTIVSQPDIRNHLIDASITRAKDILKQTAAQQHAIALLSHNG